MSRPFQIALAVGFVGLIIATGEGIQAHGFNPGAIAFIAVVLGVYSCILKRVSRGDWSPADTPEAENRLAELESRITDLQDIVISIDGRFDRLTRKNDNQTENRVV